MLRQNYLAICEMPYLFFLYQVKALCGTPEFVAPEVVSYDFISTGTGR